MASVTQRIRQIKQPRGGYLKPGDFIQTQLQGSSELNEKENIHASLVGSAVDYLTRFMLKTPVEDAFKTTLIGGALIQKKATAIHLVTNIRGLDSDSISSACKLVGFDVVYRGHPGLYKPIEKIIPDEDTIYNIKVLVKRNLAFFEEYGPVIKQGFTFEKAYTNLITAGEGDFLTKDTVWDFKTSKQEPTNKDTLQLLIYFLMGKQSIHKEFDTVGKLGIFNPRLNKLYQMSVSNISEEILEEVKRDVIGY
jgi:hypothetical protein